MAENKTKSVERTYIIPLRREWLKVSRYQRTKKAVKALREFVVRHMKSENVKVGKKLNQELWKRGIKNPLHKVKVNCRIKDDECQVELFGHPFEEKKVEEVKKGLTEKLGLTGKQDKKAILPQKTEDEKAVKTEKPKIESKKEPAKPEPQKPAKQPEKKEKPVEKKVKPESKVKQPQKSPATPHKNPAKKEKTVEQVTEDSFETAKKLNELAKKAK